MKPISLGFRTDLMVRRLAGARITEHASHLVVATPANPGFWWGNFVLFDHPPRPGDAARWEAVFSGEFPDAAYLALGVDGTDGDPGDAAELARLGVTVEVNSVLTATRLAPLARPAADATIRPLTSDDDWARAVALRLACYEDEASSPDTARFVERQLREERGLCEAGHGAWFGGFVDGQLRAAGGLLGDNDGLARFQSIETHPAHRGRGLASTLLHRAGTWGLRERGAHTLVIVADPDYHAIGLYRALGFTDAERQVQLQREPCPDIDR
ncbi:GNAT family N-acetyltransferase [Frankia sp. CNm7]|uniref:GNAT family N-acetyltransferase n=1 Tax=Frankia nepalensis TaxID=1836974 RepID=A0A937UMM7_9ACTN|nr:GNAT family N-acetyltransferase [Frankia nepalensis]MBL7500255.1 GNAT family N-acetyltransferase [Frankia nepalensis]MBL7513531.1 GNAT family N-acetyltransferase [Frankia nepalensis]MBL7519877.1 GNAT family N-acetyltransferase [Frankia nepalensis]MBL7628994.1 GNAT family N-acetyltransferase [Frankia nepalensis]